MQNGHRKLIMLIALSSILVCGCPGIYLLIQGFSYFPAAIGTINSFEDFLEDLGAGFLNGGWLVCLSGFFILIPFVLVIIAVVVRKKKDNHEEISPPGASEDEPIPPPS